MYDVIIVGARCAGSPTAMLLARKGYRVLLVDKTSFPSDTMSGHILQISGGARLKRWGLLDQVIASNCPAMHTITINQGHDTLTEPFPAEDGVADIYAPRRFILDQILVNAAVATGATLWEGFRVQELCREGDQVTGIRGLSSQGQLLTEKAPLVIGADGVHSFVAQAVQAPTYNERPIYTCCYYSYWSGVTQEDFGVHLHDRRFIFTCPTNENKVEVSIEWPREEFDTVRHNISDSFFQTLDAYAPDIAERVRRGTQVERFMGTGYLPNFFRKPYGPGWALAGDAGHYKDPICGLGISDAFRDAEFLAEAVDDGLSGKRPMQEALADYQQQRDQSALPFYEEASQLASFEMPSLSQ
jgi:flavin-dependent dehydrogenase